MTICVLIGMPGSGKSTIGRELAKRFEAEFIDSDRVIERNSGRSVADIFIEDGELGFRKLERIAVLAALQADRAVVSLGGGSILDSDIRAELKNHNTYWLQLSLSTALKRTRLNQNRPLLMEAPRATLIKLLEERTPLYEATCTRKIATDGKSVKEVVDEIYNDLTESAHR